MEKNKSENQVFRSYLETKMLSLQIIIKHFRDQRDHLEFSTDKITDSIIVLIPALYDFPQVTQILFLNPVIYLPTLWNNTAGFSLSFYELKLLKLTPMCQVDNVSLRRTKVKRGKPAIKLYLHMHKINDFT